MPYDEALLDLLERSHKVEYKGDAWRVTFSSQNALRANVRGARWNPPDVSAVYTSLSEHTARAEFAYLLHAQPVQPRGNIAVHRLSVQLQRVVELNSPALEALGLRLHEIPDGLDGQVRSREVGGAVAFLGFEGLMVPSLRDREGTNLIVYADQVRVPNSAYEVAESFEFDVTTFLDVDPVESTKMGIE